MGTCTQKPRLPLELVRRDQSSNESNITGITPQFACNVKRPMHLASIGGSSAPNDGGEYGRLVLRIRAVPDPVGRLSVNPNKNRRRYGPR